MTQEQQAYPRKPPVKFIDFFMLFLAIVSVAYLMWITFWTVSAETERLIINIDYVVCGIFAVEFLWRWRAAGWPWKFPLIYWYEILGMIPVASPIFRSFRLIRIVVVLARFARTLDRAFGDRFTAAVITRFTTTIVETIKRPVTVAVLDEVAGVLKAGHYTQNVAAALDENRDELDDMILDLIKKDPAAGRFKFVPFHDDIVRLVADTTFRITFQVLSDPRTDELVSDMIRENIDQIRESVRGAAEAEGPAAPLETTGPVARSR